MGDALPSSGASQHDHNAGSEPTYDDQAAFHQQQQQQQYSSAQHHAYGPGGPQVDMIQAHGGVRGGGSAGPYNMAGMIGALPQHGGGVAGGFRQQQPQQQHTASYGSPRLGQLPPQMAAYGQGAAGHAFYMHQPHHPQMQPYHGYGTSAVTSSLVVPAAAAAPKHQQRAAGSTSPYYQGQMHMTAIPPHLAGGYGGYYPAAQVTGAAAGQFVGAVGQPGFVVGAGPIVGGGPQQQPPYFEGSAGRGGRPADPRANQQSQASDRTPPPGSAGRGVESGGGNSKSSVVRGPPRKPKQSGHAIWIGNLPPSTDLMTLVHHVCREAPGLESLFLISKSNCAFANFRDEASCSAAQQKLHDSKFQSVRLVSRLRKNTVDGVSAPTGPGAAAADGQPLGKSASGADGEAGSGADAATAAVGPTAGASGTPSKGSSTGGDGTPQRERYFILKSLTVEDLERSVRTGIWATQSHNEQTLNTAFKTADNVFLIFSANKSGEYFGYARMASEINEDPAAAIEFAPASQSATDADLPKAIPTEPTEFAPRGRIIDDSARGTIFWEIERDETTDGGGSGGGGRGDDDEDDSSTSARSGDDTTKTAATNTTTDIADESNKAWGKPFKLEWQSTNRLPFYRTRGLRNPWNSNREVKIARDGTELEPSVGRRLISLFRVQSPVLPAVPAQMPPAPTGAVPGYPPPPAAAGLAMRSPQPYRR